MSAINVAPDAEYLELIKPLLKAKHLVADWEGEMEQGAVARAMRSTADTIDEELGKLGISIKIERNRFTQFSLFGYLAQFLQVPFAHLFKHKSETEIDRMLQAFEFRNCVPNQELIDTLTKHLKG